MESEDVSKEVEWEARRVATAFGVETFSPCVNVLGCYYQGHVGTDPIRWKLSAADSRLIEVHIGKDECRSCVHAATNGVWECRVDAGHRELLVRGLDRLGFEDQSILSQLPPLTAHEQLEARLSMPREFWPKSWLEEEEEN